MRNYRFMIMCTSFRDLVSLADSVFGLELDHELNHQLMRYNLRKKMTWPSLQRPNQLFYLVVSVINFIS